MAVVLLDGGGDAGRAAVPPARPFAMLVHRDALGECLALADPDLRQAIDDQVIDLGRETVDLEVETGSARAPLPGHQRAVHRGKATGEFVNQCLKLVERTPLRRGVNAPARLCIVLEEAHSLIPEWNQVAQESDKTCVKLPSRAILQGRKHGMGTLLITQRTANVTKTILNQCNTIFALQSFDQTGLDLPQELHG